MNLTGFLDRVVPPGNWLAVAYKGHDWAGPLAHRFYPRGDVADAASYLKWAASTRRWDTWFALASFNNAERNERGNKYIGRRRQDNVDRLKSFWLDADIKPAAFATDIEVAQWVHAFAAGTGLPRPNIWVKSGHGMHLYWCLETAVEKDIWQPHAEALKRAVIAHKFPGDVNVIADSARILRPIETWNYKDPDNPVAVYELGRLTLSDYPNDLILGPLAGLPGARPPATSSSGGSLAAAKAMPPISAHDFGKIVTRCAQVKQSLDAGGAGDSRDLWWRFLILAAHCEEGRRWAHQVSEGDPRYTEAETDRVYDEEVAKSTEFGAPLCTTFDTARPGVCQACPHWGSSITSPFTLGLLEASTETNIDTPPKGFQYDGGWIKHRKFDKKGKEIWQEVIEGTIHDLRLEYHGGTLRLMFDYRSPDNKTHVIAIKNDEFDERSTKKILALGGINVFPSRARYACELIMAWMDQLRRATRVRLPKPAFGWHKDGSRYLGFSSGGTCYLSGGGDEVTRGDDPTLLGNYAPTGSLADWQKAAQFVIADVPEFHTLLATAFGAPLMALAGQTAALLSFIGPSGVGKTSVLKAGAAVWGRPLSTMLQLDDTATFKNLIMGAVKSLPLYWDEARIDKDRESLLCDEIHKLTQGRDKGRGTSDVKLRVPGEWNTLCSLCANNSITDIIADQRGLTDQTLLRVLEIKVDRAPLAYSTGADTTVQTFDWNYGTAGATYARYISDNVPGIVAAIEKTKDNLSAQLANANDERFYISLSAVVLVGAMIARQLGLVDLDLAGIRRTLVDAIINARKVRHGYTPPTASERLSRLLEEFLRDHMEEMIVTAHMAGPGPKPKTSIQHPSALHTPQWRLHHGGIAYHMSVDDKLLRISREHWKMWCRKKGLSPTGLRDEMNRLWGMVDGRGMLGAGVKQFAHKTSFYEVSLAHPDLVDNLEPWLPATGSSTGQVVPLRKP